MVLSSGTLNLKFMQRAAARNPPTTPAQSSSSTHQSTPTPGPSKLPQSTSDSPAPSLSESKHVQAEGSEQWFMPRRAGTPKSQSQPSSSSTSSSSRWTFEQSYMPFLRTQAVDGEEDHTDQEGFTQPSSQSGGGRRNFGFGNDDKGEGEGGEGGEDAEEEEGVDGERKLLDEIRADGDGHISTVEVRKGKRGFIRPGGFDSPLKRPSHEHKLKSASTIREKSDLGQVAGPSTAVASDSGARLTSPTKKRKNPPQSLDGSDTTEIPTPSSQRTQTNKANDSGKEHKRKQPKKAQTLDEREKEAKEASRRKKMENKRRKKEERLAQA